MGMSGARGSGPTWRWSASTRSGPEQHFQIAEVIFEVHDKQEKELIFLYQRESVGWRSLQPGAGWMCLGPTRGGSLGTPSTTPAPTTGLPGWRASGKCHGDFDKPGPKSHRTPLTPNGSFRSPNTECIGNDPSTKQ